MKLTKKLKKRIDFYFENKSPKELYETLKKYGLKEISSK